MNHLRTLRLGMLAGTVVVTVLVLAACGSSSSTSSSSASSGSAAAGASAGGSTSSAARTKFAGCLKAHGVTLPNRTPGARRRPNGGGGEGGGPPGGGGGFFFGAGGGGAGAERFNNPKMRAALQACGAGRLPQRRFTPNKAAVTKFVACVKQHGYNLPAPNFSGKGPIFPATIERNKTFQAASRACASDLRPAGAGGSGASGAGSGGGSSSD